MQSTSQNNKSHLFSIRLSEEEYAQLQNFSEGRGWSVAAAIRYILFSNKSSLKDKSDDKITPKKRDFLLKKNTENVEKISGKLDNLLADYKQSIQLKNRFGEPAVNTAQTIRTFGAFQYYLKEILESNNEILLSFGKKARKTDVNIALPVLVDEGGDSSGMRLVGVVSSSGDVSLSVDSNGIPLINKYMWKASIVGTVTSMPSEYTDNKTKLVRFKMSVPVYFRGQKNEYIFLVETLKRDIYLQKINLGMKLTVYGTQAIIVEKTASSEAGQLYIYADNIIIP